MLFNTFEFLVFLVAILVTSSLVPLCQRWIVLLLGSYYFYACWQPWYTLLVLAVTVSDYIASQWIAGTTNRWLRRFILAGALIFDFGLLAYFKYAEFILDNAAIAASTLGIEFPDLVLSIILPVGVSFFIFQSSSYTVDVYRGVCEPEKRFGRYALFVSFFPQLVAGPIERSTHLLRQIDLPRRATAFDVRIGLWLMAYGLFKKMCVADLISPFVNEIYASPTRFNGSYLWIATVLFAIQIYCDFSGYSAIARGVARLLGFDLMINFKQPYFSTSVAQFWRRWHISLSTWFRDYLYFPLGGNRRGALLWIRNVLIVFVVSGLWHGAAWTFIVWGFIHGIALVVENLIVRAWKYAFDVDKSSPAPRWHRFIGFVWTMGIVLVAWVFFRANSWSDATYIVSCLTSFGSVNYGLFKRSGLPSFELLLLVANIVILFGLDWCIANHKDWFRFGRRLCSAAEPVAATTACLYICTFGVFDAVDFIYFQF